MSGHVPLIQVPADDQPPHKHSLYPHPHSVFPIPATSPYTENSANVTARAEPTATTVASRFDIQSPTRRAHVECDPNTRLETQCRISCQRKLKRWPATLFYQYPICLQYPPCLNGATLPQQAPRIACGRLCPLAKPDLAESPPVKTPRAMPACAQPARAESCGLQDFTNKTPNVA